MLITNISTNNFSDFILFYPYSYACDDYVINEVQSKRIQLTLDQLQKSDPIENSSNSDDPQKISVEDQTPKVYILL